MPPSDLRKHARIGVEVAVDYGFSDHNFYVGTTRDISSGGLFIASGAPFTIGTVVMVKLALPSRRIRAEAEVIWVTEADPKKGVLGGMGLRFRGLTPSDQGAIDEFLSLREPMVREEKGK